MAQFVIMSEENYQDICDALRVITGGQDYIKAGDIKPILEMFNRTKIYVEEATEDIREAANGKGALIGELDPLDTWAQSITENISTTPPIVWGLNSSFQFNKIIPIDEVTIPVIVDGQPVATAFNATQRVFNIMNDCFKKVIIPDYFQSMTWSMNTTVNVRETTIEELQYNGLGAMSFQYLTASSSLKKLSLPNYTGTVSAEFGRSGEMTIDAPKARAYDYQGPPVAAECTFNMPLVETIGSTGTSTTMTAGRYINGSNEFPKCDTVRGINVPTSGNSSLYLPRVLQFSNSAAFRQTYGGHLDLYIGANLATFACAANANARIAAGTLTIHIPAGMPTTKNTLDTAGVTYVQDYEPEV